MNIKYEVKDMDENLIGVFDKLGDARVEVRFQKSLDKYHNKENYYDIIKIIEDDNNIDIEFIDRYSTEENYRY